MCTCLRSLLFFTLLSTLCSIFEQAEHLRGCCRHCNLYSLPSHRNTVMRVTQLLHLQTTYHWLTHTYFVSVKVMWVYVIFFFFLLNVKSVCLFFFIFTLFRCLCLDIHIRVKQQVLALQVSVCLYVCLSFAHLCCICVVVQQALSDCLFCHSSSVILLVDSCHACLN